MTRTNLFYMWILLAAVFSVLYGYRWYTSVTSDVSATWEYYNYLFFFTLGIMTSISVCNMSTFPYFMTGVPKS